MGQQLCRQQQCFLALGQYLEIFKLLNREQVLKKNMDLTRQLIEDIQAKHQQGMALRNDVTRYELQMQTLQLALITDMLDASNIKLNAELNEVDARIGIVFAYYKLLYVAGKI